MKRTFLYGILMMLTTTIAHAQDHRFDPPWNTPPHSEVMFTIPGVDNVPDLYGDINDPQLVVFFAGNQFMCIDELLAAFRKAHPQYRRIFVETLPPGILAQQVAGGAITIGNLRISLQPDVYTAGKARMAQMQTWFSDTATYAWNKLAILVQKGNPMHIRRLADLGRDALRVSMPNPAWEGIGRQITAAFVKAGGEALKAKIMDTKVQDSSTYLTQIHHRQTPMRILYQQSDAGPVWYSEAHYQQLLGHPVEVVRIPEQENIRATYVAGRLKKAPHPQAARDFMDFLVSPAAKAVYRKYGFETE